jgi:hypothetical protein
MAVVDSINFDLMANILVDWVFLDAKNPKSLAIDRFEGFWCEYFGCPICSFLCANPNTLALGFKASSLFG